MQFPDRVDAGEHMPVLFEVPAAKHSASQCIARYLICAEARCFIASHLSYERLGHI
jgi:hypothetical protein